MSRWWRTALAVVAVIAVLALGAYLAAGVVVYDQISSVKPACGGRFAGIDPSSQEYGAEIPAGYPSVDPQRYAMPSFETVSFPARGEPNVQISGWFVPSTASPSAPTVILVHGRASCRRDWNVVFPAGMLHQGGFNVLLIDLRNHGDSTVTTGRYAGGMREYADVLGAWDWLRTKKGLAAKDIGLFGASMGAAAVLIAAAKEPQVPAVWEDSSYADTQTRIREELSQRGYPTWLAPIGGLVAKVVSSDDIYATGPLTAVAQLGGRALFIVHGAADDATFEHHAQDLAAAARGAGVSTDVWVVPAAGHTREMLVAPDEYQQRLVQFFRTHLG